MRRQFAGLVAILTLMVIASGSVVTTLRSSSPMFQLVHARAGVLLGVLTLILGIGCLFDRQPLIRSLGVLIALATGLEAMPREAFVHACFAPVLFTAVTVVFMTRPVSGIAGPTSLRWLVTAMPPLVFVQIALGAAHRHRLVSVMLHMAGAMVVAGVILVVCVLLLQRFPQHPTFRKSATTLIWIVVVQVSLGITVFILRLSDMDTHPALVVSTAAHVSGGALMLATSTVLALQYQRSVS